MTPIPIKKITPIARCILAALITGAASNSYAVECNDPTRTIAGGTCTVTTASSTDIVGILSEGAENTDTSGYTVIVNTPASATLQSIIGGYADATASTSNLNSTVAVTSRADANAISGENTLIINDGSFNGSIYGGSSGAETDVGSMVSAASTNRVAESYSDVRAFSNMNVITINSGLFNGDIYGGYSSATGSVLAYAYGTDSIANSVVDARATSDTNSITINGGSFSGPIHGGYAYANVFAFAYSASSNDSTTADASASSSANSIVINKGIFDGSIYGGYAEAITMISTVNPDESAPINVKSNANSIILNGGSFNGRIYGGYAASFGGDTTIDNATAINNIITLSGSPIFDADTSEIWGGFAEIFDGVTTSNGDALTGNILNFAANPISLNRMGNFEFYNFYLNDSIKNSDALISVTEAANINHATIVVKGVSKDSSLVQGNTVTLISNVTGGEVALNDTQKVVIGTAKLADVRVYRENDSLKASLDEVTQLVGESGLNTNPQTTAYLEGRLPGMLMINQSADLIAGLNMASLQTDDDGVALFGLTSGSKSRYNSGSHIDMDGFALTTGVTKNLGKLTVGGLFEAGWGSYDTYNDFTGLASVIGNGKVNYKGAGVIANYDFDEAAYFNGSLRAGRVASDFSSNDFGVNGGVNSHYDSSSAYVSGHIKMGHRNVMTQNTKLDTHVSALTTRVGSDSVTNSQGENLSFSALNSNRVNTGLTATYNATPQMDVIGGVAYEYEFDGEAKGTIDGDNIISPGVKGSSGIGEIGLRFTPTKEKNLAVDVKLSGFTGKREGVAGGLNIKYAF
ncbi:autotransporter outer membrane beta-barrel domain-containing protein [Yersinia mollaretii]|uniref:autotransporter outer membrane beta-barrel domain-containing protein n=1 Tax=Yersinia mollaretii TaxID=33060 RepID=UPI0005E2BE1B|nr:autotransporter outer membrane beta-barrel domain-containing protein [Yersinia mollaretii]PJE89053.1 autotransporter outer membrane beta-barrel domain-containing protein [Yersinia mollaretii]CQD40661.1 outer membrane autotransporter barrel domain [Yersinia mollaretii]CQH17100.1 outer membrane autotransporter barrel domain [Yersinia mollaretii]